MAKVVNNSDVSTADRLMLFLSLRQEELNNKKAGKN